ncbi:MAG: RnfABCDGE type electron transport complex subunit D [Prevotellaceae bacterium]|jgi:electron transport complex protein RnfD|nr:RnfABCDGE type electron transport complex subunit D [Prevotellaceae bacterium]
MSDYQTNTNVLSMPSRAKRLYLSNPYIRTSDNVQRVMFDVIISLLPLLFFAWAAFGFLPLLSVVVSVSSAVAAEFLFSLVFFRNKKTVVDLSAVVTGMLLAFTLAPFTPLYVVAFGGAAAVIFGKLLWGGLGRNVLNPALVGREAMTVVFAAAMTARTIWFNDDYANYAQINPFSLFGSSALTDYCNTLFFRPSGAIGEYSALFLMLGGLYLIIRKRISWHIPFAILMVFAAASWLTTVRFSLGGVLLGAIFMATDMPSSATTNGGKLFYAALIGIVAIVFLLFGINYEYMSYSILLVNAFSRPVSNAFAPRIWGHEAQNAGFYLKNLGLIVLGVAAATAAIIVLHKLNYIQYLVFACMTGIFGWFIYLKIKKIV